MTDLNTEMGDVQSELEDVRTLLREEIPACFTFDVVVGNISYNPNNNTVSVTVEPGSDAHEELSDALGGVRVRTDGQLEFEFGMVSE